MTTDNIADSPIPIEPVDLPTPDVPKPTISAANLTLYTLLQADQEVINHYGRVKAHLRHQFPMQIVDGSTVEFVDSDLEALLGTARLRFGNQLLINKESGAMSVPVYISDIAYRKDSLSTEIK